MTLSSPKSKAEGWAGELEVPREVLVLVVVALLGGRRSCTERLDEVVEADDETELDVDLLWSLRRWASFAPSTSRSRKPSTLSCVALP